MSQLKNFPDFLLIPMKQVTLLAFFLIIQIPGTEFQFERIKNNFTLRIHWKLIKRNFRDDKLFHMFAVSCRFKLQLHKTSVRSLKFYHPNVDFLIHKICNSKDGDVCVQDPVLITVQVQSNWEFKVLERYIYTYIYIYTKDLKQFHKNAYDATRFSNTPHKSLNGLILFLCVVFICRIQNSVQWRQQ